MKQGQPRQMDTLVEVPTQSHYSLYSFRNGPGFTILSPLAVRGGNPSLHILAVYHEGLAAIRTSNLIHS